MSLKTERAGEVPEQTRQVAQAAFPKGNAYLSLRDELESIYTDETFASLYPGRGQPAESPWRLAIVTVLQYAEGLSDRQAADAVRSRIDWKYLLGLELTDAGFDSSVLSEFRGRVVQGGVEERFLDVLLERWKAKGVIKERGKQRTDATHVQAAIRQMNRLERVGETLRATLNRLAMLEPEWLQERVPTGWYERYGVRFDNYRLPKKAKEREALALQIGRDGYQVLAWVWEADAFPALKSDPMVDTLRRVWIQEYYREDQDLHWRTPNNMPPGEQQINSPYDAEARYSQKRTIQWVGYKAHFTEICDADQPHLITHVETTSAAVPDSEVTQRIHQSLAKKDLLPQQHLVDTGYVDAKLLVDSQREYGIELVGPAMPDSSWQSKARQGFELARFSIDWQAQTVRCPQGQTSRNWSQQKDSQGNPVIQVQFPSSSCQNCLTRLACTKATRSGRKLRFRTQTEHEALQALRQFQLTPDFKVKYKPRAGVEGTLSQGVRSFDLRRSRYRGFHKTHLQHILIAVAINLARFANWIRNVPISMTRHSPFAALAPLPL